MRAINPATNEQFSVEESAESRLDGSTSSEEYDHGWWSSFFFQEAEQHEMCEPGLEAPVTSRGLWRRSISPTETSSVLAPWTVTL